MSKLNANSIELGSLTTSQRNAGVSTATGTMIYNSTTTSIEAYFGNVTGWQIVSSSFSASGGTEITSGLYQYHVFTSPGNFIVNAGSKDVEFLLVAGGSSISGVYGSGGGAGGISYGQDWPVSPGTYAVVIGAGGYHGGPTNNLDNANAARGGNSTFDGVTSVGGGIGMHDAYQTPQPWSPYTNGGSGGGTGDDPGGAGTGTQPSQPTHGGLVTNYGFPGFKPESGNAPGPGNQNGGGGGAGGGGAPAGTPGASVTNTQRSGGVGQPFPSFPAPVLAPAIPAPVRPSWTPAVGPTGLFGGGGGGAGNTPGPYAGGPGGGGAGTSVAGGNGTPGVDFTGGGGGAIYTNGTAGSGGDGICIIKYIK